MYFGLNFAAEGTIKSMPNPLPFDPPMFDDDIIIGKISSNVSEITWVHRVYTCDM